jgi:hypothetical protein
MSRLVCILRGCCTLNEACVGPGPRIDRVLIRKLTAAVPQEAWVEVLRRGGFGVGGGVSAWVVRGEGLSVGVVRDRGE